MAQIAFNGLYRVTSLVFSLSYNNFLSVLCQKGTEAMRIEMTKLPLTGESFFLPFN